MRTRSISLAVGTVLIIGILLLLTYQPSPGVYLSAIARATNYHLVSGGNSSLPVLVDSRSASAPGVEVMHVTSTHWKRSRGRYPGCHGRPYWRPKLRPRQPGETRQKLLCWVMTTRDNLRRRAEFVWRTWARRCDAAFLVVTGPGRNVSTAPSPFGPRLAAGPAPSHWAEEAPSLKEAEMLVVGVGGRGRDSRAHLSLKSRAAWRHAWDRYGAEFDWFLRADDDVYVQVEAMRRYLAQWPEGQAAYLGFPMCEPSRRHLFSAGGSAYVLSRESLGALVQMCPGPQTKSPRVRRPKPCRCKPDGPSDDVKDGVCLAEAGILPADTRFRAADLGQVDAETARRLAPYEGGHRFLLGLSQTLSGAQLRPHLYWGALDEGARFMAGARGGCCAPPGEVLAVHHVAGMAQVHMDYLLGAYPPAFV